MRLLAGTSGFAYREWKGPFYPEDLPDKKRLAYYAGQLPAVEINNTFYRMPKADLLESWAAQVPEDFRFVLKASRKITHFKKLVRTEEETAYLLATAAHLGPRLGAILFQLPPKLARDLDRLAGFVETLPAGTRAAFEFRHESWFEDEVYEVLRRSNCALCLADTDEREAPRVGTADWGYLRLRRETYDPEELESWVRWAGEQPWSEAFVFFKHEDAGAGPRLARRTIELAGG